MLTAISGKPIAVRRPLLRGALLLLFSLVLTACAAYRTQPPDIDLQRVHPSGAHRLAFSPGGQKLASGGLHGKIRIWSVADGSAIKTLTGHEDAVRGLAWLDEEGLVSADRSGRILLWDLPSSRILHSLQLQAVDNMTLAPDRSWLLVIADRRLHKLALPSLQTLAQLDAGSRLLSVAVSHATGRIALSSRDGRVRLLDTHLQNIAELPRPSRAALDLHFSPDDKTLLAGGWFRLLVWDLPQRRLEERPTEHLGKVISVAISPDGRRWLSLVRSTDSNVRLIDADNNRVLRRYQAHDLCGWQVRFSPDGRY
ncbi:MAG: WD40 repeat domain-containing protein, partial [Thiogranum sp.]